MPALSKCGHPILGFLAQILESNPKAERRFKPASTAHGHATKAMPSHRYLFEEETETVSSWRDHWKRRQDSMAPHPQRVEARSFFRITMETKLNNNLLEGGIGRRGFSARGVSK